jgi:uncharacterized protein (DUF433 family)
MVVKNHSIDEARRTLKEEELSGDRIQPGHPLFGLVWINPQRMSGTPCFAATRVPVRTLFDHLEAGDPLEKFLDDFPSVTRAQAVAVLAASAESLLAGAFET